MPELPERTMNANEATLQMYEAGGITVEVSENELRELRGRMETIMNEAEALAERMREICGPNPPPVPQHFITMLGMGAGYYRHCKDTINRLFSKRNAIRRMKRKLP